MAGVAEVAVGRGGESAEAEEFGGGNGVMNAGGFDEFGVELVQISHGFALFEVWEER